MKRSAVLLLVAILFGVLAACGQVPAGSGATPPKAAPEGTPDPAAVTRSVLADPARFLGQEVTVEGTLQSEGQGTDVRFYLAGSGQARLEVTPWAPVEVIQSPSGKSAGPKSMVDFVGKTLRLTGTVEEGGAGFILKVISAAEAELP